MKDMQPECTFKCLPSLPRKLPFLTYFKDIKI